MKKSMYKTLNQIYKIINKGFVLKLQDGSVKLLAKKSVNKNKKNDVLIFLKDNINFLQEILLLNNNLLDSNTQILRLNMLKILQEIGHSIFFSRKRMCSN